MMKLKKLKVSNCLKMMMIFLRVNNDDELKRKNIFYLNQYKKYYQIDFTIFFENHFKLTIL